MCTAFQLHKYRYYYYQLICYTDRPRIVDNNRQALAVGVYHTLMEDTLTSSNRIHRTARVCEREGENKNEMVIIALQSTIELSRHLAPN